MKEPRLKQTLNDGKILGMTLYIDKGGRNDPPVTPKPKIKPPGQRPDGVAK